MVYSTCTLCIWEVVMIIDKNIANFIINELKPVVSFDINLIGNDGIIISSTNKKREGTLHYGALLHVVREPQAPGA